LEIFLMVGAYSVGDWIGGRFQVFDVHEGGMSLVYVVNDQMGGLGPQVVALKTLRSELLQSRIRISRFAAECRIWVQLGEHPNIVRAHSVEVIEGRPYVVLELIQGGDLSRWIGTTRLDLPRALRFSYQFCVGMEHALRQGLHCHRDIKPGNLLVTEDGTLKITDFGLARVSDEMVAVRTELPDGSIPLAEPTTSQPIIWSDPRDRVARGAALSIPPRIGNTRAESRSPVSQRPGMAGPPSLDTTNAQAFLSTERSIPFQDEVRNNEDPHLLTTVEKEINDSNFPIETSDPRLTRTGARLGTGAYMAPEQSRDPRSVDVRADIYAFGVVLFEMITGGLPFKGRSLDALSRQHSQHKPPSIAESISVRPAKLAKSVDEIVQRCLMKDPVDRYSSVAELRHALKQIRAQLQHK
jgi:serine/threonine protein kinase